MNRKKEQKFPTNEYAVSWTNALPLYCESSERLFYTKTSILKAVCPPTEKIVVKKKKFSIESRRAANKLYRTGHCTTGESEAIRIALQDMSITSITPELKFKYLRGIKELRERYEVVGLGNSQRFEIAILTDPLTIRCDRIVEDIGRWWISISKERDRWSVYCKPDVTPSSWLFFETCDGISYHPHLPKVQKGCDIWAQLCLGDAGPTVTLWCSTGAIERAMLKVVEQLSSFNLAGAYSPMKYYTMHKCPDCFSMLLTKVSLCTECYRECRNCSRYVLSPYYPICYACKSPEVICPNCRDSRRCIACGRYTCTSCAKEWGKSCTTCSNQTLSQLGVLNVPIHENESSSSPVSMESSNVLGTPPLPVRSVGDGIGF